MEFLTTFLTFLAALVLAGLYITITDAVKWRHLPSGPTPLPFIGNLLNPPPATSWAKFSEHSTKHGGIYTAWTGRRPTLMISDPTIASELLEKRSANYSSRPRSVMLGEVFSKHRSMIVLPYGKQWQQRRKLFNHALKTSAIPLYKPRQAAEATKWVVELLRRPTQLDPATTRFAASVIFSIGYGRRIDTLDAKVLQKRLELGRFISSLVVPGRYIAETFPILAKLPNCLAPWNAEVERKGQEEINFNMSLVDSVQVSLEKRGKSTDSGCLTEVVLDHNERERLNLTPADISSAAGSLFSAGVDTTASSIKFAVLALLTNPEVLRTAEREINTVLGATRSPTFDDNLPYIDAFIKEVFRWRPVAPLGLSHATSADDAYRNFRIPAATTVTANAWAMNLNEEYFPHPDKLLPSRFLPRSDPRFDPNLIGKEFPNKFGHSGFGWGRRICPGVGLATNTIRIAIAKLIWAFEILPIEEQEYNDMNLTSAGIIQRPAPFQCRFKIRSDEHLEVLERELIEAEKELEKFPAFN